MRLIFDARMIGPYIHGIGRVELEILNYIKRCEPDIHVVLLTNEKKYLEKKGLLEGFDYREIDSPPFSPGELVEFPWVLKKLGGDLLHAPSIAVPLFEMLPTVITIHDLNPILFRSMLHRFYVNKILARGVKYARAVITVSNSAKKDIVNYFGCEDGKVKVTPLSSNTVNENSWTFDEITRIFHIKKPYIFTLGSKKPHKNMKVAVKIFNRIKEKYEGPLGLVMLSGVSPEIGREIDKSPWKDDIITPGFVEDYHLDLIYRNAEIFIYPSLFEGFGLPPLEAMQRGVPVVSSNRTSLPEVVGDGGILVDPDDVEKFAQVSLSLLRDEGERKKLSQRALCRAEGFSWEKCGRRTVEIYRSVL